MVSVGGTSGGVGSSTFASSAGAVAGDAGADGDGLVLVALRGRRRSSGRIAGDPLAAMSTGSVAAARGKHEQHDDGAEHGGAEGDPVGVVDSEVEDRERQDHRSQRHDEHAEAGVVGQQAGQDPQQHEAGGVGERDVRVLVEVVVAGEGVGPVERERDERFEEAAQADGSHQADVPDHADHADHDAGQRAGGGQQPAEHRHSDHEHEKTRADRGETGLISVDGEDLVEPAGVEDAEPEHRSDGRAPPRASR